jgi:hypothetical protein
MSWNEDGASQAGAPGVEYLDGLYSYALVLNPQPCRSSGPVTGDLCSRLTADGEAAGAQQHQGLALHDPEKCLAQPVEKVAQWSSNG